MKTFFVTTPVYYVNGEPHVGTLYTTIAADVVARYKRLNKYKVFFLTGTDEHGEKAEQSAKNAGISVKKYVDKMSARFKTAFDKMNISYDRFIRTTDKDHIKTVTEFYKKVLKKGDIYKGFYEGLYCVSCETFWTEKELIKKCCPDCGKKVKKLKEETYFFKQSKFQKKIINHINKNPEFIQPKSRRNEIVSFLKKPLKDVSITRTSFKWGITAPNDKKHIIYVWFDALINYLTAGKKLWPADVQLMGKEITRFHCITWPAMLFSAGLKLPKKVFGHGWWTVDGKKMSKSIGNTVYPYELCKKYNVPIDTIRYMLFRQMPFGTDGDFSEKIFIERVNNELASDLGNLITRCLTMFKRYSNCKVPKGIVDKELNTKYKLLLKKYHKQMTDLDYYAALNSTSYFVHAVNKYIADNEPWKLAKTNTKMLNNILYNLAQSINCISCMIYPFMPQSSEKIDKQLGEKKDYNITFKKVKVKTKTKKGELLFPKIEQEKTIKKETNSKFVKYEDFKKLDFRTAVIKKAEKLSDKLYKLIVMADKKRTLVAGIAKYYTEKELIGKKIVMLINLEPRKIHGVLSEGMMLAAEKGKKVVLLTTDKEISENAQIL